LFKSRFRLCIRIEEKLIYRDGTGAYDYKNVPKPLKTNKGEVINMKPDWVKHLPVAITVCDTEGKIIYMNEKSCKTFQKSGGAELIGKNLLDCHPEPAKSKLKMLLETAKSNTYTIEKNGKKKLIHQMPWYDENENYGGLVEISIELPTEMPNYKRT